MEARALLESRQRFADAFEVIDGAVRRFRALAYVSEKGASCGASGFVASFVGERHAVEPFIVSNPERNVPRIPASMSIVTGHFVSLSCFES